jgi:predicted NAD/FAD-binding protein
MLSAIWSMKDTSKINDFPALATFTFLNNHRLLSNTQPQWKTIVGGSIKYVSKIQSFIEKNGAKILLNQSIKSVSRKKDGVYIKTDNGSRKYDYVVFGTHADTTLKLLEDASADEKTALKSFKFGKNTTVLHKDTSVLPKNKRLIGAWNYVKKTSSGKTHAVFTYSMNILQQIPKSTPVLVTLNPTVKIKEADIYATEIYEHPEYTLQSVSGQQMIRQLQGKNRTLFTGAYLGYGFHEDGVTSAINAVKTLGVKPSWYKIK